MEQSIERVQVVPISVTSTKEGMSVTDSPSSSSISTVRNSAQIKWSSDIDQTRFFTIGTVLYTGITVCLHPVGVIKTRIQVLNRTAASTTATSGASKASLQHGDIAKSPTVTSIVRSILKPDNAVSGSIINDQRSKFFYTLNRIKGFYRGMGIVLALAIPTRVIYISTLENTREKIGDILNLQLQNLPPYITKTTENSTMRSSSMVATFSGGIAGGIAAMSAQMLVVPMDVISQRQMIMNDAQYAKHGGAIRTIRSILKSDTGWRGLYRGFGLSLFTSLPSGSIWWGCYSGCQHTLNSMKFFQTNQDDDINIDGSKKEDMEYIRLAKRALMQLISGLSAAAVAATLTQPLDVVKTRIQVARTEKETYTSVVKDLIQKTGYKGFFRGTTPRIAQMGIWGTVMSSAYEYLRHISLKES